jgi:predicted amidohydrolase
MIKVSVIQFNPFFGDPDKNLIAIRDRLLHTTHSQLVVLPELASTGYNFEDRDHAWVLSEVPEESELVKVLHNVATTNNQYIVTGFNERSGDKLYNSTLLIGHEGILGVYRKMHLFMYEKEIFEPGDGKLEVYDLGFCKIGMQICFDYLFPEPWRILAGKGADIIVHPSNLLTQNAMKAMPGIALMNRVFTVTANRIGTEDDLTFNGSSMIINPSGDVLARGPVDEEAILTLEIDPSESSDKMITPLNHVFNDRRPEHY